MVISVSLCQTAGLIANVIGLFIATVGIFFNVLTPLFE